MIQQGEIYWADLDPSQGREQRGRRPVLIISRDSINHLPLTLLVMAGTGIEHYDRGSPFPTDVWVTASESGLAKDTVFLGLQVRSIDYRRLGSKIGQVPKARIQEVQEAINYIIGLN